MKNQQLNQIALELAGLPHEERAAALANWLERSGQEEFSAEGASSDPGESAWVRKALLLAFQSESSLNSPDKSIVLRSRSGLVELTSPFSFPGCVSEVRCREDLRLARELKKEHAVEAYLKLAEEEDRDQAMIHLQGIFRDGTPLTPVLAPELFALLETARNRLGINIPVRVTCTNSSKMDAVALAVQDGNCAVLHLNLTSDLLKSLKDLSLLFVLGHELGHILSEDRQLFRLNRPSERPGSRSLLPAQSESIYLRWRRMAELSADRCGLIACRDLEAASQTLYCMHTGMDGLSPLPAPDQFVEAWKEAGWQSDSSSTHPSLPVRLKALELFARSEQAATHGIPGDSNDRKPTSQMEDEVSRLIESLKRHPVEKSELALMEAVAMGGVRVLACDGDIGEGERRILIDILQREFTEEPESVLKETIPLAENDILIVDVLETIREECSDSEKKFVISCLAEIALQDGSLFERETGEILKIGRIMGMSGESVQHSILATVRQRGFGESKASTGKTQKRQ